MKARKIAWQCLATGIGFIMLSGVVRADSLAEQRIRYAEIKQAWDNKQLNVVEQLLPTLRDYPLYPYLEYRQLSGNLMNETAIAVSQFIQTHPTLPPARNLVPRFVNELARRQDWSGLLAFSPQPPTTVNAKCNYYNAKWNTGDTVAAWEGAKTLWLTGRNLPASCDQLFSAWRASGQQPLDVYLERIRLAMKADNSTLVTTLAQQLPATDLSLTTAIIDLQKKPTTVLDFARNTTPTDFTRQAVITAFSQLVRLDVDNARLMVPALQAAQKFTEEQAQELNDIIAWRLMGNDVTPEQAEWRDKVIMRSTSTTLIERRVRMALGSGDRNGLNTWIARLPMEAKEKDEWRYWQADLLLERGRAEDAKGILTSLMKQRGFYPMVAAQRLGEKYSLRIDNAGQAAPALVQGPEMARVRELMFWGLDNTARSEWANLITSRPPQEQAGLARYAFDQDWWDLSVQATIAGKLWDHLEERFPLAYKDLFAGYLKDKTVSQSFAMAIARQESAWNPKIRSPVGASGLMQVMPATAKETVKRFNIVGYNNPAQLLDPLTNINIGTSYLQHVFERFENNRIFAAAAYNAGPSRVNSWLRNSGGKIDAIAFVESIPFSETRGYVKNVLAYDAFYRYFLGQPYQIMTENEWQRRY